MSKAIDLEYIRQLRDIYREGDRVEMIYMGFDYNPIKPGERGNVLCVDDFCTIHVVWDNGRCLGLIPGKDLFADLSLNERMRQKENTKQINIYEREER